MIAAARTDSEHGKSHVALSRCEVCGKEFDPLEYQVVVSGLSCSFDRVDCALHARDVLQAQPLRELGPGSGEGRPAPHIRAVV